MYTAATIKDSLTRITPKLRGLDESFKGCEKCMKESASESKDQSEAKMGAAPQRNERNDHETESEYDIGNNILEETPIVSSVGSRNHLHLPARDGTK
ncbi:hypothetical protein GWI33_005149 [Rhynchophorus ferrugineus]|uniref:Uncharacterized protein n=1 Tax=Rhynchophorus ferrugineus TaxID=354439 RepID=A0A834IKL9_RHYFE|nr:hypothetical protein GWI33_005149 [Rhynchophorus ferrugineus]